MFIADEHPEMTDWDFEDVAIDVIDIEVGSENGFPDPYLANEPITAIAIKYINGAMTVFACGDYKVQITKMNFLPHPKLIILLFFKFRFGFSFYYIYQKMLIFFLFNN